MELQCRELEDEGERLAARRIVERAYAAQGYDTKNGAIAAYLQGSGAATFGLFANETLYGTLSLVPDGPDGLPMDAIYRKELAPWRAEGKKLAEVVQFAVDHETYRRAAGKNPSPLVAVPLFVAVLSRAIKAGLDYLCISINPAHDRFYDMLGFKQIGPLKQYDSVNAPAIARALYVPHWQQNPTIKTFLGKEILRGVSSES